jgi:predicted RNA binding protein YcfA (HicA-like mRNA interferase family)
VTFNELIRLLVANGFTLVRQKGSVRYYGKAGWLTLIRVDYHGPRQVPTGTCHAILQAAGIPRP